MTTYAPTAQPTRSPWGAVQSAEQLAPGVWRVSTAGHGGIKLSPARNRAVPGIARAAGGWYEEDCDWAIAALVHPDAFPVRPATQQFDGDQIAYARRTIGRYQSPEVFEALLGEPATEANCDAVSERAFRARHADDFHVVCAWGDHAAWVPKGFVGVFACRGGRTPQGEYGPDQLYALVTKASYDARIATRGVHIVDPALDQVIEKPENLYAQKPRGAA